MKVLDVLALCVLLVFLGIANDVVAQVEIKRNFKSLDTGVWADRIMEDLAKVEKSKVVWSARTAAIGFASIGDTDRLNKLVQEFVPQHERARMYQSIVQHQALHDHLQDALSSVDQLPEDWRQQSLRTIVIQQAARGDFEDAKSILSKITDRSLNQRATLTIAMQMAIHGKTKLADEFATKITDEKLLEDYKKIAKEATHRTYYHLKIKSHFLIEQTTWPFSAPKGDQLDECFKAIIAAEQKDENTLNAQAKLIRNRANGLEKEGRFTELAMLSLALAQAGRKEQAKAVLGKSFELDDPYWLDSVKIFGARTVASLMIWLGMDKELMQLMNGLKERTNISNQMAYDFMMDSIGKTLVYLNREEDAENLYASLDSPNGRILLAAGVLVGTQYDKKD